MPRSSSSVSAKFARMQIALALAAAPLTFATSVVWVLGISHSISYWWLALSLGWTIAPLSFFLRLQGYARRECSVRVPGDRPAGLTP